MPAAFFTIYSVLKNPGLFTLEQVVLVLPSFAQIGVQLWYILVCMYKPGLSYIASDTMQITKAVQTAMIPYITAMTYQNGPQHDPFTAGFFFMNGIFNMVDMVWYYIFNYTQIPF